jgi:hypothetical protein
MTFLSLKTDVNVPTERNKQNKLEKKISFCWQLGSHWRKKQDLDPDPDPLIKCTDPRIRIRAEMSRIWNTDKHRLKKEGTG